jgi:peptide/nickel transport system substrate-binding protein
VQSVLDTLGLVAHGPFVRAQSFADPDVKGLPFNMDAARALLDSAGWRDADGDGVREKNGRPLQLELVVPTSSSTRMRMSVILQEQLKQLGVRLTLDQVEANVFGERVFATRRWDGFLMGWHPDPGSSALTQSWSGRNAKPGGSNLSRYASAGFDAHLDSARSSSDAAARRAHFRQAFDTLNEDAPAVFLYELRVAVGVHHRVQPKFRPDAWWAHLDEWSIPTDQRIARDRVGLSAAR